MAYPVYQSNGGIGTGTDFSVAVSYPSTVNADDILIAAIMDADDDSFDTPAGWTKIDEKTTESNLSVAHYWKRADGTESGSVTFTSVLNAGSLVAGIIYRYSGCVKYGVPFEGHFSRTILQGTQTAPQFNAGSGITATERLAVAIAIVEDDTISSFTAGFYGFTEDSRLSTTAGTDAHFATASVGTDVEILSPNQCYWTQGNEYYSAFSLYLIPEGDVPVTLNTAEANDFEEDTTPTLEFTPNAGKIIDFYDITPPQYENIISTNTGIGQSFTGNGRDIKTVRFKAKRDAGVTTGQLQVRLYAHTGTYGTTSEIGSLLATSETRNASSFGTANDVWESFDFSTPYTTVSGTYYIVLLYVSSAVSTGYIQVGTEGSAGSGHDGNYVTSSGYNSTTDSIFEVLTESISIDDNEVEIQIDTVNTFDSNTGIIDEDDSTNGDLGFHLSGYSKVSHSFTADGSIIRAISVSLKKFNSPTNNPIFVSLWSHSGTYGTSSVPLAFLRGTPTLDIATLTTSYVYYRFDLFEPFQTVDGDKYCIVIENTSTSTNYLATAYHSGTAHDGNSAEVTPTGVSWTAHNAWSIRFKIHNDAPLIQALSSVPDAGFLNTVSGGDTHPFNDNEKLSYTVQDIIIDEYDESNQSSYTDLSGGAGENIETGQSITGNGRDLKSLIAYVLKNGSPTGNAVAKLYAHSGTFGTSSVPTGSALATSDNVDVAALSGSYDNVTFNFPTPYTLVDGTKYFITIAFSGGSSGNSLRWGLDNSAPTHNGNFAYYVSSWVALSTEDLIFSVIGTTGLVLPTGTDTYYWRARAINPSGINVWDEWSATKSFVLTEVVGTTTTTTTVAPTTTTTTTVAGADFTKLQVNIADVWKDGADMKINIGDVWKDVVDVWQNIGDVWKKVT